MKKIQQGSVVVLNALVTTAGEGDVISGEDDTLEFTCGKGEIFEAVEKAVMGLAEGEVAFVQLEPEEHVGDYDAELVRVEERTGFPDAVEEGMMFEGLPSESELDLNPEHAKRIYLVTDVTDDVVVLDGNHPLAGIALKFKLTVASIDAPVSPDSDSNRHPSDFAPNFKAISRP